MEIVIDSRNVKKTFLNCTKLNFLPSYMTRKQYILQRLGKPTGDVNIRFLFLFCNMRRFMNVTSRFLFIIQGTDVTVLIN